MTHDDAITEAKLIIAESESILRHFQYDEQHKNRIDAMFVAIESLQFRNSGCEDCIHSEPEDKHRVFCQLKGQLSNRRSLCEALEWRDET